ncbi:MAG: hypothetical protein L0Y58_17255 [Verrucomicrobia subdivision 3 bacterium]|nr:hypothetical protein [Limisphaerales bacterium]
MGLKKLKGATNVTVSLNQGEALVQMAPLNSIGVEDVRRVVTKNGFTPRETHVVVEGTLSRKDTELLLTLGRDRRYVLTESPNARDKWAALQKVGSHDRLRVSGVVPDDAAKNIRIAVLDFAVLPEEK